MYRYRIVKIRKAGNKNIYEVQDLSDNQNIEMTLKELKPFLDDNEVINAVYKNNQVSSTLDIAVCMQTLLQQMENIRIIKVEVVNVSKSKIKRKLKVYNYANRDITYLVYQVLHRFCDITMKDELEVTGIGVDAAFLVMKMLNDEGRKCGLGDVISSYISLEK